MSLDHALLVSLAERPSSGYDLGRRFDRSIGHFWHASHQQIYRVLARMEAAGWIAGVIESGAGAPDRTTWSLTAAGRRELDDWLASPGAPADRRDELLVKLRGAAFAAPGLIGPELERHRAVHAQRLEHYRAIEARDFAGPLDRQRALQYLVLKSGIRYEQSWLDWHADALQTLALHDQETSS